MGVWGIRWVALACFCLTPISCYANTRVALVIGNGAYEHAGALANPVNDATDVAGALKELGFEVIAGTDLDKRNFDLKIRELTRRVAEAEVALFFYAGHALQVAGQNFLVPIDAKLDSERDLDFEAVKLDFVLRQMELDRDGKTSIVFLDACRDNPLAKNLARSMGTRQANIGRGLAQVQAGVGTFVAYSTQPGNVALDGTGRNSPFTAALVRHMTEPGRTLTNVMVDVRRDVLSATSGKQVPWDHSALTGDFYFHLASAPQTLPKPQPSVDTSNIGAVQERMRQLEDELKKKSDAAATQNAIMLAQAKERMRQLDESTRLDQQRIFELQRNSMREKNADTRMSLNAEISRIHLQIARRGQEQRTLREQIERLEAQETGSVPERNAAPASQR